MSSIDIKKIGITDLNTDCIVNAANSGLAMGSGVCGAIFRAAGPRDMQTACNKIGGCPTGGAVITPGFALKAKYVIHAVGPIWRGGNDHEPQDLYSCYRESLERAKEKDCHSIGFPLISSGIFGYPKDKAWRKALQSCSDWISDNPDYDMNIIFAVLDDSILELGLKTIQELGISKAADDGKFVFFWKLGHKNEEFSNWYPKEFVIEGIQYNCVEQYMMARKAILFGDVDTYQKIMASDDPGECKNLGKLVSNFDPAIWDSCKREIVYNANNAKFTQNPELMAKLRDTGDAVLAEASPQDKIWGIGMTADDPDVRDPEKWSGENLLGGILMQIREESNRGRVAWFRKYIPVLEVIEKDKQLKDACRQFSVYNYGKNPHESVANYLHQEFMCEAYDNDIVIHNYREITEKCGTSAEIAKPKQDFLEKLTSEQILACIAWHFRRDHFSEGSLVCDSIGEGYMLRMMQAYMSKIKN